MTSQQTDKRDRAERQKITDQALADDRQGRDRLRRLADAEQEPSHGDPPRSADVPNTSGRS